MVTRGSQVLSYRRGTFSRVEDFLKGAHCIGFGGHVTESDLTLFNTADFGLLDSAVRELTEELSLPLTDRERLRRHEALRIIGLINDDSSAVGRRHFAFVLRYDVSDSSSWDRPQRGEKSITQLRWLDSTAEEVSLNDFEYWSQLCFRQYLPISVRAQPSFFLRRRAPLSPPHVLCVVGTVGSGKSEATKVLTEHFGYREVNSGRVLAGLLGLAPADETGRESFQTAAWRLIRRKDGPKRLAAALWKEAQRLGGPRLLVDGIRQRATLEELRALATPLRVGVVFVHTPPDVAFNFYKSRSPRTFTVDDFLRVRDSPVEKEAERLLGLSDAVLYNWQGRHMYREAVLQLMSAVGVKP
jgi:predicted NUDIX family phosphoesterase/dephospho-CoA kinase